MTGPFLTRPSDRRRTVLTAAAWRGRYTLDDRPADGTYHCRVIEVSLRGAVLELFGPAPLDNAGLEVQLRVSSEPRGITVHARARRLGPTRNSGVCVSVEWDAISAH